ncbi:MULTISPECIES: sigma-54 dependent transcriptional regulator [unclassified Luteibacter]|uniref:sigma-54 dependent transcriptional regulator n=1 Tax=unclassified Luteibacter TaxID=2620188 RepID=UPI0008CA3AD5|nr:MULTISPECIES: sigma-54 dependent transcriptional regulator [unclassified Luteibacter]SEO66765.1 sigma-54 specific transcriptional regulator, flagellar regulatory protein A [Luteibacter sp. UNC138MFCol5.1]SEV83835.1 transcriptional regulator [Luteibacter sp. 329MFSha]
MKSSHFLVVESDATRAETIVSALAFLGYRPVVAGRMPVGEVAESWRGVYVGTVEDENELEAHLASLGRGGRNVPMLVAADSPLATSLIADDTRSSNVELIDMPLRYERLSEALRSLQSRIEPPASSRRFVGQSGPMQRVNALIRQVAPFDSSVLVLGESGSGKELVARTIHDCSPRRDKPFVAINCGAIPAELLESELFGHEKGAFTGAISTRKGRFEMAEGGTLFLDEIGDMSLPMQVKLLRVLQERVFERVGGNRPQRCDVRIIAATHRDLEGAIERGSFREDLFYRLSVFPLEMPPLRQRLEDLPALVSEFNHRLVQRGLSSVRFSPSAVGALCRYSWPGNVRELSNLVERMAILMPHGEVRAADLPEKYRGALPVEEVSGAALIAMMEAEPEVTESFAFIGEGDPSVLPQGGLDLKDHLAGIEIGLIRQALNSANGVVAHAAKLLRVQRTTLVEKLRKYGLSETVQAG